MEEKPSNEKSGSSVFTLSDFNSRTQLTEKDGFDDEYDPAAHRPIEESNSTKGSLAHLLKSSLGTGILAMPMAFYNAGLLFGMIGTIIVGFVCTHCVHILVRTSQEICKNSRFPSLGFAETAEKVFEIGPKPFRSWANFAKQFVDGSLMATYFAASCVYIVFIATSLHDVVNFDAKINWDIRLYIAMTLIPLLLIGQIRQLKYLVPFSAIANFFIIVTFAITLYYMFSKPLNFEDKPLFSSFAQLPLFFATVVFAMEGIGVVMPVENTMRKPQNFLGCPGILNTAMITVILLYAIIGFFGYVQYGNLVKGSITLNLPEGEILADVAKILMALAILFTYGLQFYVPVDILWRKVQHRIPAERHNVAQITMRTGIILITGAIAAAVPKLEPFISLVGAVFFSILGIFVPSIVESIYLYPNRLGCVNWILYKNIFLAIVSIFCLVAGATVSIEEIIKMYS